MNISFTITALGAGISKDLTVIIDYGADAVPGANPQSIVAVDPSGEVDYSIACSDVTAGNILACAFGDTLPGRQIVVTVTFAPQGTNVTYPIVASLVDAGSEDSTVETCIKVVSSKCSDYCTRWHKWAACSGFGCMARHVIHG